MIEELVKYWEEYKEEIRKENEYLFTNWSLAMNNANLNKDTNRLEYIDSEGMACEVSNDISFLIKKTSMEDFMDYLSDKFKKDES